MWGGKEVPMRAVRRVLLTAFTAAGFALILCAGGPAQVQTCSYPWVQLPPQVGLVVQPVHAASTAGRCVQPPSFVGVAPMTTGPTTSYVWQQPPTWIPAG
jgi:hypothetical protein